MSHCDLRLRETEQVDGWFVLDAPRSRAPLAAQRAVLFDDDPPGGLRSIRLVPLDTPDADW
jgi:hypothetical protein